MGGPEISLVLEVKHRFSDSAMEQVERLAERERSAVVLVVPKLSPKRRQELLARGFSWIEYSTGFTHVRAPGLAIDLPEERTPSDEGGRDVIPSLAGKAGTVVEALIELAQRHEQVSQPDVAEMSGSTQAWTSVIFSALVTAGALEVRGAGPRKVWCPDVERLLDLWVERGGPTPERTDLYAWARSTEDLLERLHTLGGMGVKYAIGGVAAADLHEPVLTSIPLVCVWIPVAVPPEEAARALDAQIVESGANLAFWQAKGDPSLRLADRLGRWREESAPRFRELAVVTPSRAVVETMGAPGRGREVAERLREKILRQTKGRRNGAE